MGVDDGVLSDSSSSAARVFFVITERGMIFDEHIVISNNDNPKIFLFLIELKLGTRPNWQTNKLPANST